ncbi:hypothetical protein [Corynebacterium crudilactis]|uniref:hypothetical protein n=1 Tax=Corynebacterium crudilactis TaxID=1652495 RepID=UPI001FE00630|nr:hypothetical protein [Corynebacterium crudilactis]
MSAQTEYVEQLYVFSTTQQAQEISAELSNEFLKENPGILNHEISVQHSVEDPYEVEKSWVDIALIFTIAQYRSLNTASRSIPVKTKT